MGVSTGGPCAVEQTKSDAVSPAIDANRGIERFIFVSGFTARRRGYRPGDVTAGLVDRFHYERYPLAAADARAAKPVTLPFSTKRMQ
jgi:hypothetical protein